MPEDNFESLRKVVKDLSQDYNDKVSFILSEIDILKKEVLLDKLKIMQLSERYDALYVKLYPKLIKQERFKQRRIKKLLTHYRIFKPEMYHDENGDLHQDIVISKNNYIKYRKLLTIREIYLNKAMERIGLTARHETKKLH